MKIQKLTLGQLQTNTYIIEKDFKCIVIDPADSADFILEKLQRENMDLVGIVATHGHFDHILAVGEMQLSFDHPLYIHKEDLFLVHRMNETAEYFLDFNPAAVEPKKTTHLKPGKVTIGPFTFQVIHTPGHTPGSCSLYFEDDDLLFTGDTLFKDGIGRYDFSYADYDDLQDSLEVLSKLPEFTTVYPGHGENTTISEELEDSEF